MREGIAETHVSFGPSFLSFLADLPRAMVALKGGEAQ
jgi:hypothetical protein